MSNTIHSQPFILGLSCLYHDSSAVLLRGDEIVAAVQEERFTRKKFDNRFPVNSIKYCLDSAGITSKELDCIAYYEEPHAKLDRLVKTQLAYSPLNVLKNAKRIIEWIENKFRIEEEISYVLPGFRGELCFFHHHQSHASSAFYPSPFSEASILTVDGVGEWSCSSIAVGKANAIDILEEQRFPHSIGLLYSAFTQYIGFKVDSGEYKLMGLCPYGKPDYVRIIKDNLVEINDDGSIKLNTKYFDFMTGSSMINEKFSKLFSGRPRLSSDPITQKEMDIACSIQKVIEEVLLKNVKHAVESTGLKTLCMSGGVALNCVANSKILNSGIIDQLWVQPASGDAGGALGAAFLAAYSKYNLKRVVNQKTDKQKGSFLGPSFTNEHIKTILDSFGFVYKKFEGAKWSEYIATLLSEGQVVGLFKGKMEYGPRSLGNRSILGDARNEDMQRVMNMKIKYRESFRPFAPIVLNEKMGNWFEPDINSPYMQFTVNVKSEKRKMLDEIQNSLQGMKKLSVPRSDIPAVTHVDYSARVQTVEESINSHTHEILSAFEEITGCPVLINTSFNIRGEPIVCSPFDALRCFMNTNIDALVMEDYILRKKDQGDILREENFKDSFDPD